MAKIYMNIEADGARDLITQLKTMLSEIMGAGVVTRSDSGTTIGETIQDTAGRTLKALEDNKKTDASKEVNAESYPTPETDTQSPVDKASPPKESKVTLENLNEVPYEDLLEFCTQHPDVGVDAAKSANTFFYKLVKSKIKTYLTT